MASIAVVGPGAIGGVVAGALQGCGRHRLSLCSRRPLAALVVESTAGRVTLPAALTDPAQGTPVDWVLVATKAYDAAGAAAWFPALVGPATQVAIIQNGVEHRERFAPWLPPERLLPVMIDCPAERRSPEHVVQRGPGQMAVPAGMAGEAFAALFAGTTLEARAVDDFRTALWRKLCINSAGIINALLLKPAGVFHDDEVGNRCAQRRHRAVRPEARRTDPLQRDGRHAAGGDVKPADAGIPAQAGGTSTVMRSRWRPSLRWPDWMSTRLLSGLKIGCV